MQEESRRSKSDKTQKESSKGSFKILNWVQNFSNSNFFPKMTFIINCKLLENEIGRVGRGYDVKTNMNLIGHPVIVLKCNVT